MQQLIVMAHWGPGMIAAIRLRVDAPVLVTLQRLGICMLGGRDATSNYSDVQMAEIQSNGSLGTWRKTTSFRGGRAQFVAGYSNGFVYLYGGCTDDGLLGWLW